MVLLKHDFYEKELSESSDERYLFVYMSTERKRLSALKRLRTITITGRFLYQREKNYSKENEITFKKLFIPIHD